MKEIDLPTTRTVSVTLHRQDFREMDESFAQGKPYSMGDLINPSIEAEILQARENGGKVLYAASSLESKIEDIILRYFMVNEELPSERRELFDNEILKSNGFTYAQKKELLSKIINSAQLLDGKSKNRLQSLLKRVGSYRNSFAHGRIKHDTKRKCFIEYYSGGPQSFNLTDDFWTALESEFSECEELLKTLSVNQSSIADADT